MSVSRGGGGLLVREGGSGVSRSSPTFLPLLSKPGGSGEGVQAGKTHWPSGLGPQPGGPLQDPTLPCKPQGSFPASLSTRSWGPNPRQRSPGLREGELEIVLTALPPLLPVCLSVFFAVSLALAGSSWVLCEHSDFRGRQWLVGSCEITNWLTYSGTQRVGSLYPIKQVGIMAG